MGDLYYEPTTMVHDKGQQSLVDFKHVRNSIKVNVVVSVLRKMHTGIQKHAYGFYATQSYLMMHKSDKTKASCF